MTARLRKTFAYPSDDESPLENELDEATQDNLITSLAAQDATKTTFYRHAFLTLPLTATLYFIYAFLFDSLSVQQRLLSLLSVSSLLCTAYVLYCMPLQAPERKGKVPLYRLEAASGPVDKYLVWLNAGLSGLLFLVAGVSWSRDLREEAWREALPGIVCALTMTVRQLLAPVDLDGLKSAKFGYKGA